MAVLAIPLRQRVARGAEDIETEVAGWTALADRLRGEKMEMAAECIKHWKAKSTFTQVGEESKLRDLFYIHVFVPMGEPPSTLTVPANLMASKCLQKLGSEIKPGPPPRGGPERNIQNSLQTMLKDLMMPPAPAAKPSGNSTAPAAAAPAPAAEAGDAASPAAEAAVPAAPAVAPAAGAPSGEGAVGVEGVLPPRSRARRRGPPQPLGSSPPGARAATRPGEMAAAAALRPGPPRGCRMGPEAGGGFSLEDVRLLAADFYASGYTKLGGAALGMVAAVLREGEAVAQHCPRALLQAALLRMEDLLLSVYQRSAESGVLQKEALKEASDLQLRADALEARLGGGLAAGALDASWPLARGAGRVRRYHTCCGTTCSSRSRRGRRWSSRARSPTSSSTTRWRTSPRCWRAWGSSGGPAAAP
ncbi:unnamed protein product [Prorocentrum cordatum]|uniref:Uncharacterized protein n=1 Tax=Prorocentrum cordatum TaxID=2364126 RepID=A0ABN9SJD1_9DINO|nr:unnamed protein product [Polarella glacialis]